MSTITGSYRFNEAVMSATLTDCRDFIEATAEQLAMVEDFMSPSAAGEINSFLNLARANFENPTRVAQLLRHVNEVAAQDLRSAAEVVETTHVFGVGGEPVEEAARLRTWAHILDGGIGASDANSSTVGVSRETPEGVPATDRDYSDELPAKLNPNHQEIPPWEPPTHHLHPSNNSTISRCNPNVPLNVSSIWRERRRQNASPKRTNV
jgi:hypothetical protein